MMSLVANAPAKPGCCKLQLLAPASPETVNRSSTPPFGLLGSGLPSASKKYGKRASRVGPWTVMNVGMVLSAPLTIPLVIAVNSGLLAIPVPPIVGWEWHAEHWLKLNRGPKPVLGRVSTVCTIWKRPRPLLKKSKAGLGVWDACPQVFVPSTDASAHGTVAVAPTCPLMSPPRTPGSHGVVEQVAGTEEGVATPAIPESPAAPLGRGVPPEPDPPTPSGEV